MKFVLLSDIHATSNSPVARKDDILEAFLHKFDFVLNLAKEQGAKILQAGDFFHRPRDWRLLGQVMDVLQIYHAVRIFTIYGQHDMYMYSDVDESPTTLNILDRADYVRVLSRKHVTFRTEDLNIYGCSWGEEVPKPKGKTNVLVIHANISPKDYYPGQDYTSPEVFLKKHKFDLILCGDIHRHFVATYKNRTLVNTGPMIRYDGSEYNMKHKPCAYIWDSETLALEKVTIPHEPASKVLTRGHIEKGKDISESLLTFAEAMQDTKIEGFNILASIRKSVEKLGNKRVKKILAEVMEDN